MSDDGIWIVGADGGLTAMRPSKPRTEDDLQTLIARHIDLIGEGANEFLLVKREQEIPDSEESGGRWSLDHLFVTQDAIPVLVEVKRAVDTRLRREVVAQMLDYAANGTAHWSAGRAAQNFAATCAKEDIDAEERLAEFLGPDIDQGDFWDRMDQNFRDGRLKMLFVADEIPQELATIVEFLNEHTRDHIEVRAIELRHFEGDGGLLTLVRRVVGETARVKERKRNKPILPQISIEEWIEQKIVPQGSELVDGIKHCLEIVRRLNGSISIRPNQGPIVGSIMINDGRTILPIWIKMRGNVAIAFDRIYQRPGLENENTRQRFFDRFVDAVGPLSSNNLKGGPSFRVEQLNDPTRAQAFESVLADLFEAILFEPENND